MTSSSYYYSFYRSCTVLILVFRFATPPVHADERPEKMDLQALSVKAAQLKERLDQNPSDYEALQGLGTFYHYMALKDSKTYTKKAVQYLEQAYQKRPDDNMVLCYLGSSYTLLAKDAWNPFSKSSYANKGFERMDKAIRKDPDNITIRLTRAYNSKNLPKFLNRRSIAYEDFEHLAGLFEKGLKVPSSLKISVYQALYALYEEDGKTAEAKKYGILAEKYEKYEKKK